MAVSISMTAQEFKTKFVQVLKNRRGQNPEPPELTQLDQQTVNSLDDFRTAAIELIALIPSTGSCTYTVDGKQFCIKNVSQSECDILGGDFNLSGTCAATAHPWP
jgi:hypothetical protein